MYLPQTPKNLAQSLSLLEPGMFVPGMLMASPVVTSHADFSTAVPRGSLLR